MKAIQAVWGRDLFVSLIGYFVSLLKFDVMGIDLNVILMSDMYINKKILKNNDLGIQNENRISPHKFCFKKS